MKLSVLIPYRSDSATRTRIYEHTSGVWAKTGIEVIYASDGLTGPFSYARAINAARKRATGDWFLSYSVDALPPTKGILGLLEQMMRSRPWAVGWRGQARFSEAQTELLYAGAPSRKLGNPEGGTCLGSEALIAVRAETWDTLRGYDERFVGWGPEDKAWHLTLKTIFSSGWDHPTDEMFRTLWHPPVERQQLQSNLDLFEEYRLRAANPFDFRRWYFSPRRGTTH